MKRCPQCSFLYLDSDQLCDLDKTPLLADDFETDPSGTANSEQEAETLPSTVAVRKPKRKRKLKLKTLSVVIAAALIIGLTMLLAYQKMRPNLQASAPQTSQGQESQASRGSQVAQQTSDEVPTRAEPAPKELESSDPAHDSTSPAVEGSPSTTAKTTPNTRPDSARVRVSSSPVSTGDVTKSGKGPVNIRLADGSTLEADEVWRTKAGIWYRRKGIVTFIKPNRVRAMNR